jgi:putative tricarboxylic transport membrane protein
LVWGLIASLYLGNFMLLLLNLPLVGMWVRLLSIPTPLLYGGILVFATLGSIRTTSRCSTSACCWYSASSAT